MIAKSELGGRLRKLGISSWSFSLKTLQMREVVL